ncbi:hypothetical protein ANANG_G00277630, partial [Anguilla anguilla]
MREIIACVDTAWVQNTPCLHFRRVARWRQRKRRAHPSLLTVVTGTAPHWEQVVVPIQHGLQAIVPHSAWVFSERLTAIPDQECRFMCN